MGDPNKAGLPTPAAKTAPTTLGGLLKLSAMMKSLVSIDGADYLKQGVYSSELGKYAQVRQLVPALDVNYFTTGYTRTPSGDCPLTTVDCIMLSNGGGAGGSYSMMYGTSQTSRGGVTFNQGSTAANFVDVYTALGGGNAPIDGVVHTDGNPSLIVCAAQAYQVNVNLAGSAVGPAAAMYLVAAKPNNTDALTKAQNNTLGNTAGAFYTVTSCFSSPSFNSVTPTGLDGTSQLLHLGWFQSAGLWIAVAYNGAVGADGYYTPTIFTSPNGIAWTSRTPPAAFRIKGTTSQAYPSHRGVDAGSAYVFMSGIDAIRTTDGITWTMNTVPNSDVGTELPATAAFAMSYYSGTLYAALLGYTADKAAGYYSTDAGASWKVLPRLHSNKGTIANHKPLGRFEKFGTRITRMMITNAPYNLGSNPGFDMIDFGTTKPEASANYFGEAIDSGFYLRVK